MRKIHLRYFVVLFVVAGIAGLFFPNQAGSQKKFKYIGVKKCARICHKGEKRGSQYEIWEKSKHSKAFVTLATPIAKEVLKKAGGEGEPQKSEKCLTCHSTCLLYTSPSPRDLSTSRMPSSA